MKVIILAIIAIFCFWCASLIKPAKNKKSPQRQKTKPVIQMLNREGDMQEDERHTYIAGLHYHVSKYDIGGFTGWVAHDTDNTHDRRARGVYNSFGKLLGYIPARELDDFIAWCDSKPVPCVGFIYTDNGEIRGRVKMLLPCNAEFLQTGFSNYLQWVCDNYGAEYLPKSMSMQIDIEQNL